jgi:hypothetical protein
MKVPESLHISMAELASWYTEAKFSDQKYKCKKVQELLETHRIQLPIKCDDTRKLVLDEEQILPRLILLTDNKTILKKKEKQTVIKVTGNFISEYAMKVLCTSWRKEEEMNENFVNVALREVFSCYNG